MSALSPLSGVKRKSDIRAVRSALDPKKDIGITFRYRRKSPALQPPSDVGPAIAFDAIGVAKEISSGLRSSSIACISTL